MIRKIQTCINDTNMEIEWQFRFERKKNCTWVFFSKPYTKSFYIQMMMDLFPQWRIIFDEFPLLVRLFKAQSSKYTSTFCRLAHAFFTQITHNSHEWFMFSCPFDLYLITRKSDDDDDDDDGDMLYSPFATLSCKWLLGKSLYRCSHFTLNAFSDPSNHPFLVLLLLLLNCVILFHTVSLTLPVVLCISCNFQNSSKISTLLLHLVRLPSHVPWQSDFVQYVCTYGNWLIDTWKIT